MARTLVMDDLRPDPGGPASSQSSRMRDAGLVGVGVVVGWLASKTWSDPGCQLGLVVFLIATAVMTLACLLAVVGHGRDPGAGDPDEDDEGDHR
ncbi:MAG TPA: hypothetical protein VFS98_01190 [Methylomirabilota bacterium]|nr:hypothetical protein [Methylomirabilota bacterium]